jgi:hypothetical protein
LQVDAPTTAWFIVVAVLQLACDLWHESHLVAPVVTGTWVAGLPLAALPLWQVSQVPLPTALAGVCAKLTELQLEADLWQLSHTVTPAWTVVFGLPTAGGQLPLWQSAHCVLTDTEAWNRAGVQAV